MTRYNAMYPDNDIFYSMPDYREWQNICKWCGKPLPLGNRSYCTPICRVKYGRAINVDRNALLPFLILCRDNFTCKNCDKDLALVNKHGMRLPSARLSATP